MGDMARTPDAAFSDRRLAATYDVFEGDREDLDAYEAIVDELAATSVLDVGCGVGVFACRLAKRGIAVIGVDPAGASLDIARAKPGAEVVRWILGDAASLPPMQVDLAVMTGNVAQVFLTDDEWAENLGAIADALRPDGHLVFETRIPSRQAWLDWTPSATRATVSLPDGEVVETWCEVTSVVGELVSFRWTNVFGSDGATIVSDSTLRSRERDQVERSLPDAGFEVSEVRDATDRPGNELVFIARRSDAARRL
jgi:SAM-dependent methyltransferase